MNQLLLLVLTAVVFCYFGGKYCPSVLRQNKQILLGVGVGIVLCSFMDLRLEGYGHDGDEGSAQAGAMLSGGRPSMHIVPLAPQATEGDSQAGVMFSGGRPTAPLAPLRGK